MCVLKCTIKSHFEELYFHSKHKKISSKISAIQKILPWGVPKTWDAKRISDAEWGERISEAAFLL